PPPSPLLRNHFFEVAIPSSVKLFRSWLQPVLIDFICRQNLPYSLHRHFCFFLLFFAMSTLIAAVASSSSFSFFSPLTRCLFLLLLVLVRAAIGVG
ncbi:hypothetical protein PIB30_106144, partial [Stylosanthes scabra]|nr:hypothetical protein [Stylosanthes scabra]